MKIQIVSDLHLEFGAITIPNAGADVLILSGDICLADDIDSDIPDFNPYSSGSVAKMSQRTARHIRYKNFFEQISADFPHIVYVAGNHEFYHGKWVKSLSILREFTAKFPNIHFLENDSYELDDVTFIGGTLWTDLNRGDPLTLYSVHGTMYDYKIIRNENRSYSKVSTRDTVERHKKTLHYIKSVIEKSPDSKFVVVGHHAPSQLSIAPKFKDEYLMNGAYASDLSEFILDRPQIQLWTHGHMHDPSDYLLGDTRIVCNPRGYKGEHPENFFDPTKIVEI